MLTENNINVTENAAPQPVAEAPAKKKVLGRDCRVKMLVMSFVTFMVVVLFPIFTYTNSLLSIDLYAMDIGRISSLGKEITNLHEGELVSSMEKAMEESVADTETPEGQAITEELGAMVVDLTKEVEPKLLGWFEPLNLAFTVMFIVSGLVLFGFIISLVAGARNMKKTYLVTNLVILSIFITVSAVAASKTGLGTSIIGDGMWVAMLMVVLSCIIPFVKKKEKKVKKTA